MAEGMPRASEAVETAATPDFAVTGRGDAYRAGMGLSGAADTVAGHAPLPGMSVGVLVERVDAILSSMGATERRRESREIVAALLDVSRAWLSGHAAVVADPAIVEASLAAAARRVRGAPLAYAVGRAAFRHLVLSVDERVLIPRPETEGLVDLVLQAGGAGGLAVDVGTGSGAVALALASEGQFDRVIGTDVSTDAIAVASGNAERLAIGWSTAVEFRTGSYLAPVRDLRARAVVSNPPYISYGEAIDLPTSVRGWEPVVALLSGEVGCRRRRRSWLKRPECSSGAGCWPWRSTSGAHCRWRPSCAPTLATRMWWCDWIWRAAIDTSRPSAVPDSGETC